MIYLHCNDFEEFGYNGPCCPHNGCHENFFGPPSKPRGSEPIVETTACCGFNDDLITRDNCAKLARQYRKREAVWRNKRRIKKHLQESAFRLANARLKTWGRSGPGETQLDDAHEENKAVEQYLAAVQTSENSK